MPIIKSAKKRVRQAEKSTIRNVKVKRTLREAVKAFTATLTSGKPEEIKAAQQKVDSALDIAAKKNILHKNKVARRKAGVNAQAKAATTAQATAKAAPAKTAAKPTAKKAAAKPVTKKKPATAAKAKTVKKTTKKAATK